MIELLIYPSIQRPIVSLKRTGQYSEQRKNRGKLALGQIFKQMARDRRHRSVWVKYTEFSHIKQELHKNTNRFEVSFYCLWTKIVFFLRKRANLILACQRPNVRHVENLVYKLIERGGKPGGALYIRSPRV